MQAHGSTWEHEVRVALPSSYDSTQCDYPVLWIMDNQLEPAIAVLGDLDLILVAVGAGRVSFNESGIRRTYDFQPGEDLFFAGFQGDQLRKE